MGISMERFVFAVVSLGSAMTLSGCLPGETPNHIVVEASVLEEFSPDAYIINGTIRSRDKNNIETIRDLSKTFDVLREILVTIDGVETIEVLQTDLGISPVYNSDCQARQEYSDGEVCPVEGFFGNLDLSVTVAPASVAGNVFSAMSQIGVEEVTLGEPQLFDPKKAQEIVIRRAVEKARADAESIAKAAGATVVGPIKIQRGQNFRDVFRNLFNSDAVVTVNNEQLNLESRVDTEYFLNTLPNGRTSPDVKLFISARKIAISAEVVAAFEIE